MSVLQSYAGNKHALVGENKGEDGEWSRRPQAGLTLQPCKARWRSSEYDIEVPQKEKIPNPVSTSEWHHSNKILLKEN